MTLTLYIYYSQDYDASFVAVSSAARTRGFGITRNLASICVSGSSKIRPRTIVRTPGSSSNSANVPGTEYLYHVAILVRLL